MALVFNADDRTLTGPLADVVPDDSEYMRLGTCLSKYRFYECTLPTHPTYVPHIAGTGHEVVTIWTDAESDLNSKGVKNA